MTVILQTRNLTKKFDNFVANDKINLEVEKGEIRAIVGENGAGKTTLMNMLYGELEPTSGTIYINSEEVHFKSPKDAIKHKIGMVHQHFMLVPSLTVYENILLGEEISNKKIKLLINDKKEKEVCKKLLEKFNLNIDINEKVKNLSVGEQQKVEIIKMLYRDIDILILDEPTAVLTPQETKELLDQLKDLKKQGKTIVIITHKLKEVMYVSDSVTIISNGRVTSNLKTSNTNKEELAELMVGRKVLFKEVNKRKFDSNSEKTYSVYSVSTVNSSNIKVVDNVGFDVFKGEIYGIAGVDGNGQSELMKILTGMMELTTGAIYYLGKEVTNFWADDLRTLGVAIIPEDRYVEGLCADMSLEDNSIAGSNKNSEYTTNNIVFDNKKIDKLTKRLIDEYHIKISDFDGKASQLSGGNAQKLIVAREMLKNPKLLIASQPTRGVDIGATEFIHEKIVDFRNSGGSVILISSDLSEIMSLSDRIGVMYKGQIIGEVDSDLASEQDIGLLMAGIVPDKRVKA